MVEESIKRRAVRELGGETITQLCAHVQLCGRVSSTGGGGSFPP